MKNFKVGDTVIRTGSSFRHEGMIKGEKYVIQYEEHGIWGQRLRFDTDYWYSSDQFALAEAQPIDDPDHSPVEHPKHYNSHPSGVECITIARHHNFNIGNVFKYLWRIGLKGGNAATKGQRIQEIDKAIFYLRDERARIEAEDE